MAQMTLCLHGGSRLLSYRSDENLFWPVPRWKSERQWNRTAPDERRSQSDEPQNCNHSWYPNPARYLSKCKRQELANRCTRRGRRWRDKRPRSYESCAKTIEPVSYTHLTL